MWSGTDQTSQLNSTSMSVPSLNANTEVKTKESVCPEGLPCPEIQADASSDVCPKESDIESTHCQAPSSRAGKSFGIPDPDQCELRHCSFGLLYDRWFSHKYSCRRNHGRQLKAARSGLDPVVDLAHDAPLLSPSEEAQEGSP